MENNARMVNNKEAITLRAAKKKAEAAKKRKKTQSPLTSPHTVMLTSKGHKEMVGESSQPKKH